LPSLQFVITDQMSLISPLSSNDRSIPLSKRYMTDSKKRQLYRFLFFRLSKGFYKNVKSFQFFFSSESQRYLLSKCYFLPSTMQGVTSSAYRSCGESATSPIVEKGTRGLSTSSGEWGVTYWIERRVENSANR
jgi:hypothetical protein